MTSINQYAGRIYSVFLFFVVLHLASGDFFHVLVLISKIISNYARLSLDLWSSEIISVTKLLWMKRNSAPVSSYYLGCNTNCDENELKRRAVLIIPLFICYCGRCDLQIAAQMFLCSKAIFSWQYEYILEEIWLENWKPHQCSLDLGVITGDPGLKMTAPFAPKLRKR